MGLYVEKFVQCRDEVLKTAVRFYAAAVDPAFVLMDDSAHLHGVVLLEDYLEGEEIELKDWPAYSSDRNPIENLWDALGGAVC